MRSIYYELSGGLADIGVLLPLVVTLIINNSMNPFLTLFCCGLFYIVTSLYYRVPIPVQPLKVFCTVAIAAKASPELIKAGSMLIGIIFLCLSIPAVMDFIKRLFPLPVIRGIQFSTGLILIDSGIRLFRSDKVIIGGSLESITIFGLSFPTSIMIGVIVTALMLFLLLKRRYPLALIVLLAGVCLATVFGAKITYDSQPFHAGVTNNFDFGIMLQALWILVLPQVPLSIGNAIIATENTLKMYFGEKAVRAQASMLAFGMGCFNVLVGLVGGVPCCHGCGGVTAHYRLGARTRLATSMTGVFYIVLAGAVSYFGYSVFQLFPYPVLGVLLIYVGIEHGLLIEDIRSRHDLAIVILISAIAVATRDMTTAFLVGSLFYRILLSWKIKFET